MTALAPFPWRSVEALATDDVVAARAMRRAARALVDRDALDRALADLAGEPASITVRRVRRAAAVGDDAYGVLFAAAGDASPARRVLVEVESALAGRLVSRVLEKRPPRVVDAARAPSAAVAGAFAAIAAAVARRASSRDEPLRVIAAGPGAALARDLLAREAALTATLTVLVGDDAFEARVTVPDGLAALAPAPPFDAASLRAMGETPISLAVVAASVLARRADVAALAPGDAFLPGAPIPREGAVSLVAASSDRGVRGDLAPDGRVVLGGACFSARDPRDPRDAMADSDITSALEDAPVLVRVEIGDVALAAREWAELSPGDVVSLRKKPGDGVVLRVAGVEVARGDLVIVDGDVGVRIVSR